MPRQPDETRKPQLLAHIVDYLLEHPLSSITFRGLAENLGVSTFTLVYHFGSKEALIAEVVRAIRSAQRSAIDAARMSTASIDDYFRGVRAYWEWTLTPRSMQLHRLQFEAAMIESLGDGDAVTRNSLVGWHALVHDALLELGVPAVTAPAESRAMANFMYGLQFDLVVTGDIESVTEAFEHAIESYRARITALVAMA